MNILQILCGIVLLVHIVGATSTDCTTKIYLSENGFFSCYPCPPGFFVYKECIENATINICKLCPTGEFHSTCAKTATSCKACGSCPNGQIKTRNCTTTKDNTCACENKNDYWDTKERVCSDICRQGKKITRGDEGEGLLCVPCEADTFSNETNSHKCEPCSTCLDYKKNCTKTSDAVCTQLTTKTVTTENVTSPTTTTDRQASTTTTTDRQTSTTTTTDRQTSTTTTTDRQTSTTTTTDRQTSTTNTTDRQTSTTTTTDRQTSPTTTTDRQTSTTTTTDRQTSTTNTTDRQTSTTHPCIKGSLITCEESNHGERDVFKALFIAVSVVFAVTVTVIILCKFIKFPCCFYIGLRQYISQQRRGVPLLLSRPTPDQTTKSKKERKEGIPEVPIQPTDYSQQEGKDDENSITLEMQEANETANTDQTKTIPTEESGASGEMEHDRIDGDFHSVSKWPKSWPKGYSDRGPDPYDYYRDRYPPPPPPDCFRSYPDPYDRRPPLPRDPYAAYQRERDPYARPPPEYYGRRDPYLSHAYDRRSADPYLDDSYRRPAGQEELKKFEIGVAKKGWQVRQHTPADGNCFFWAIKDQLDAKGMAQNTHTGLRRKVIQHMHKLPQTKKMNLEKFLTTDLKNYIDCMSCDGTYADHVCIQNTSEALCCKITVVLADEDDINLETEAGDIPTLVVGYIPELKHYVSLERLQGIKADDFTSSSSIKGEEKYKPLHSKVDGDVQLRSMKASGADNSTRDDVSRPDSPNLMTNSENENLEETYV